MGRQRAYRSLLRILAALGATEVRKSVVFLSERFLNDPSDREFALVSTASRHANAPISVVDVGGLAASDLQADQRRLEDVGPTLEEQQELRAGLAGIAAECGGFAITGTDDLAHGLERLLAGSRHYYLIGYQPTNGVAEVPSTCPCARPPRPGAPASRAPGRSRYVAPRGSRPDAEEPTPFALAAASSFMSPAPSTDRGRPRTLLVPSPAERLTFVEAVFSAELDVPRPSPFETEPRRSAVGISSRRRYKGKRVAPHRRRVSWCRGLAGQDRGPGPQGGPSRRHPLADVPGRPGWQTSSAVISDASRQIPA
jgi:hypothetical protein